MIFISRKQLLEAACIFLAFSLLLTLPPRRIQADTQPNILCPYSKISPAVDGNAADWSSIKSRGAGISFYDGDGRAGSASQRGTTVCGTITDAADCRVDLWLAHDGTYLYVLAEVQDDAYEPFGSPGAETKKAYLEDTLHLYIDSTNAKKIISETPILTQYGYEQFGISTDGNIWGENTDFTNSSNKPAPKGAAPDGVYWQAKCQVQNVTGGHFYMFEERIALGGKPDKNMASLKPGNSYGFNAEFCDADDGNELQGFIFWSSDGAQDAWNYENLWGAMTLEVVPEPSVWVLLIAAVMFGFKLRR